MTAQAWLGVALDGVPAPLIRRVERLAPEGHDHASAGPVPALVVASAGIRQLEACDPGSRRDPEAAFDLLAADGLLTLACRRALDEAQPIMVLTQILDAVTGETGKEPS